MKFIHHTVRERDRGRSLSAILKEYLSASSTLIKLNKERGGNLINGVPAFTTTPVGAGDVVSMLIDDAQDTPPSGEDLPSLNILFEDEFLAVIDKPAGYEVHPSSFGGGVTVMDMFIPRLKSGQGFHPVNRLDRGTSGAMAVAKYGYIHTLLTAQLHTESFIRIYKGICSGVPAEAEGRIDLPILRDPTSVIKRMTGSDGAKSVTDYAVEKSFGDRALLKLSPLTGRTHQLRLHMASMGHPLLGDWLYGIEDRSLIARPALHSSYIRFIHPITGSAITALAPLPGDMEGLLK